MYKVSIWGVTVSEAFLFSFFDTCICVFYRLGTQYHKMLIALELCCTLEYGNMELHNFRVLLPKWHVTCNFKACLLYQNSSFWVVWFAVQLVGLTVMNSLSHIFTIKWLHGLLKQSYMVLHVCKPLNFMFAKAL